MRVSIFVILLAILIMGCNQQDDAIVSSVPADPVDSGAQLLKSPAQSGPYVVRYETYLPGFGVIIPDEKSGLTVFIAVDNEAWCSGEGLSAFDIVPLMEIAVPSELDRFLGIQKGVVQTSVHEGVFNNGGLCEFVENHPLLAKGTSYIVSTDNDEFPYIGDDHENTNAFGLRARGELTGMNGETVEITAITRGVWDGNDFNSIKFVNKVILK